MSLYTPPYDPSAGKTYQTINRNQISRVEIFPPVGIARVGDSGVSVDNIAPGAKPQPNDGSKIQYYYGPEVPGQDAPPTDPDHPSEYIFRDEDGGIKRQVDLHYHSQFC